jgi:alcohol dehydrogenase (cytochrome c)
MATASRILLLLGLAATLSAQVPFERLLNASKEPQNWLTYSGSYKSWRHSPLDQINTANAKDLSIKWVFQSRTNQKFQTTPLVVDGVMYITEAPNNAYALDAATGRVFWEFHHNPDSSRLCCGQVNRGLAILGDTLFMGTVDGYLLALDAKTGELLWKTKVVERSQDGYALVHAPLVVKDKVIVGPAGGELGIRGFLAAYDAATGKQVWKFNLIPGPGEPGHESWGGDSWKTGGAPIWLTGSYDPDLNLTYWGVGNPGPDFNSEMRPGDNLYTSSVVALDPDTGKLKWHYQFTPHDVWDWDAVQVPVLVDMEWEGRPRKVILWANRNGFYYTLDRTTGEFLQAKAFVKQTWNDGFDEVGRPIKRPGSAPTAEGNLVYPGQQGATNWYSPSYSPRTGLFYIPAWVDYYSHYNTFAEEYVPGRSFMGGSPRSDVRGGSGSTNLLTTRGREGGYGAIRAIDAKTGERKWDFEFMDVTDGGVLTTGGDVLFTGNREQYFYGIDARSGAELWKIYLGGNIRSAPITYEVNGVQQVSVCAGNGLFTFAVKK